MSLSESSRNLEGTPELGMHVRLNSCHRGTKEAYQGCMIAVDHTREADLGMQGLAARDAPGTLHNQRRVCMHMRTHTNDADAHKPIM